MSFKSKTLITKNGGFSFEIERIRIGLSAEILATKISEYYDEFGNFKKMMGQGIFCEESNGAFIAFDNSTGDFFVEVFKDLQPAYKWLAHNEFCECKPDDTTGCTEFFEKGRCICNNCGLFVDV